MNRLLIALLVALASARAAAFGWPWQAVPEERLAYCKGFVVGGLASQRAVNVYRTDLWLAWNTLIREGAAGQPDDLAAYEAGLARFNALADETAVTALLEDMQGDCALGRTGHEVTGW